MGDSGSTINRVGSTGGSSCVGCSDPGVNQGDNTPSRGIGSGEVDCVRREDVTEGTWLGIYQRGHEHLEHRQHHIFPAELGGEK